MGKWRAFVFRGFWPGSTLQNPAIALDLFILEKSHRRKRKHTIGEKFVRRKSSYIYLKYIYIHIIEHVLLLAVPA